VPFLIKKIEAMTDETNWAGLTPQVQEPLLQLYLKALQAAESRNTEKQ
jgi:hypothetical protein